MSPARERRAKKKSCEEKIMKSQIRKTKVKKNTLPRGACVAKEKNVSKINYEK